MTLLQLLTLFRMGLLGAAHGWGGGGVQKSPALKSVTHILKWWNLAQLYLIERRSRKYMNYVTHHLRYADISHQHVFTENQEIQVLVPFWCIISNSFKLFWGVLDILINMVTMWMMSAKMFTLGLLKIRYFEVKLTTSNILLWHHQQIFFYVTQVTLYMWSCDQNLVTLAFLWEKLS